MGRWWKGKSKSKFKGPLARLIDRFECHKQAYIQYYFYDTNCIWGYTFEVSPTIGIHPNIVKWKGHLDGLVMQNTRNTNLTRKVIEQFDLIYIIT